MAESDSSSKKTTSKKRSSRNAPTKNKAASSKIAPTKKKAAAKKRAPRKKAAPAQAVVEEARPQTSVAEEKAFLDNALSSMERLLTLFRVERIIHLVVGIAGFALLVWGIVLVIMNRENQTKEVLIACFGSGGLVAVSSARITFFFNKAFKLIEDIIRKQMES